MTEQEINDIIKDSIKVEDKYEYAEIVGGTVLRLLTPGQATCVTPTNDAFMLSPMSNVRTVPLKYQYVDRIGLAHDATADDFKFAVNVLKIRLHKKLKEENLQAVMTSFIRPGSDSAVKQWDGYWEVRIFSYMFEE